MEPNAIGVGPSRMICGTRARLRAVEAAKSCPVPPCISGSAPVMSLPPSPDLPLDPAPLARHSPRWQRRLLLLLTAALVLAGGIFAWRQVQHRRERLEGLRLARAGDFT